jgi:hypothetical protein
MINPHFQTARPRGRKAKARSFETFRRSDFAGAV